MAKDKLTDYDSTASGNLDVGGISVAEGMLPSGVNNAIREQMSHLADFAAGTSGVEVLKLQDDTDTNSIKLQAPASVTATTTFTLPDGDGASGQAMITDGAGTLSWAAPYGNRNLIINGAMQVAQRGTSSTTNGYGSCDRFYFARAALDNYALTQTQQTVTDLAGFSNSFRITTTTAESAIAADELAYVAQKIEAQNLQQLAYGTSSAKQVTLSFYVKSSVTGTFSTNLYQVDDNRIVNSEYTISSANTWERKEITYAADQTGVIDNNSDTGFYVTWNLAVGSNRIGNAAATWEGNNTDNWAGSGTYTDAVITTLNATWEITGVQLEVGDTATPFEHRSFGDELARCRRYFEKSYDVGTTPGTSDYNGTENWSVNSEGNGNTIIRPSFNVEKRAAPTMVAYQATGASGSWNYERSGAAGTNTTTFDRKGTNGCRAYVPIGANFASAYIFGHWTADAEL